MPRFDPDTVSRLIRETAETEILPRFRHLADGEVMRKQGGELVTVADEAAEARLSQLLSDHLPGSVVLGEEGAARDPSVFDRLNDSDPVWVIDPIDGTNNFAAGRETFAVMVALVQGGETLAAWIDMPARDTCIAGVAGAGATHDGERIILDQPELAAAEMSGTLNASTFATKAMARQVDKRRSRVSAVKTLGCAGAEYVRLVSGEIRFALFTKLMPWDHAPGSFILAEAGGVARLLDGHDYVPTRREGNGLLHAYSEQAWHTVYEALFGDL
ncbi:inositol monophosphatase family protein [Rhodovibrio salinarum]|uniref:Inositol monophosphatase n=1 Tax=Rhodovibrio salinarum TaxID=1087 RepID=A0A934QJ83_9PROT|nr:inositol monophosphatase [Rhodovibrio salinarum]MBK1697869.1 inositol monophosphatase [Rhodovibrio salinarum]